MDKMNALLVSMSVNMYSQNGSTDWRQRPECSHILSQLQTFMTNKPIIGDKEFNSLFYPMIDRKCNILFKLFIESKKKTVTDPTYNGHLLLALERMKTPGDAKPTIHVTIPPGSPIGCDEEY